MSAVFRAETQCRKEVIKRFGERMEAKGKRQQKQKCIRVRSNERQKVRETTREGHIGKQQTERESEKQKKERRETEREEEAENCV